MKLGRRSTNVVDAGVAHAPHGIISQLVGGAKLLKGDFRNGAEKLGILGRNEAYKKFGLSDPRPPKYDDEISRGMRKAASDDPATRKLYADRAKWRLRSRDANEQRPGEPPRAYDQRDGKLTPRPKTFGH
jgi:hypothetical protein